MALLDDSFKVAAIALVAGVVAYGPARSGSVTTLREATTASSTPARTQPADADQLIGLYLGEPPPTPPSIPIERLGTMTAEELLAAARAIKSEETPPQQEHLDTLELARRREVDVSFLIGLLPDPVDSDARWMFDSLLDAINSALAQQHYSLFRASFPDWEPGSGVAPATASSGAKRHESQPAVVVFHRELMGKRPSVLVVLLAYETPTAGVHVTALQTALEYVDRWRRCSAEEIRILGPTFSGSAASLAGTLDGFREKTRTPGCTKPTYRIVTGSATSYSSMPRLNGNERKFESAVLSDKAVLPVLIKFITDAFGAKTPSLAVLIESTPYGDDLGSEEASAFKRATIHQYRFPLHISSLRANAGTGSLPQDRPAARTPLVLADRVEPTDRLPVITPATTAPTVELMLDTIFDQMRRDRVDAIGLFATDTRDKLFLAQQIARALPGVLLFTTEADALYTHPQYRDAVRGMVVASSYPPVPTDRLEDQRYMFPTSSALGTFNATLALLRAGDLLEYRQDKCAECGMRPPVWLSIVEGGSLWPVALRKPQDTLEKPPYSSLSDKLPSIQRNVEPSVWMWFVSLLLCVLAACHLAAETLVFSHKDTHHWAARLLRWSPDNDQRYVRHLAVSQIVLLTTVLMFAGVWSAGAFRSANGDSANSVHYEEVAAAIMLVLAAIALVASLGKSCRRWASKSAPPRCGPQQVKTPAIQDRSSPPRWGSRQQWLPWAIGLPLGAAFIFNLGRYAESVLPSLLSGADRLLFFDRSTHFASGASPLFAMTLVLAPIYVWGLVRAVGLGRPPIARLAMTVSSLGPGTANWLARFNATIEHPLQQIPLWHLAVALITLVMTGLFLWGKHVVTVESWQFTEAFLFAWLIVQLLFSISLIEALHLWGLLRDLLRVLGAHPLASAYRKVTDEMLGDRLSPRRPTVVTLGRVVIERQKLLNLPQLQSTTVGTSSISDARRRVDAAIVALHTGPEFDFDLDVSSSRWGWTKTNTFKACTASADVVKSALAETLWQETLPNDDRDLRRWCQRAEVFLAMFVALFFRETLSRLASTLCLLVITLVLLVAAQAFFTFHPRQILLGLTWVYGLVTVGTAVSIFVAIEKDHVMSALASTNAGKVDWDRLFWGKMLLYAGLPIVTLFAAQFPQLGDTLIRWVGPVQQTLP